MIMSDANNREAPLKVFVALASYGNSNDEYLHRIIREYHSLPFEVDIVVVSNIEKRCGPGVECIVGLPNRDPWSLPFSHKKLFVDRADDFDVFVYSEDDILISEANLRALVEVTEVLPQDEVAGFLRVEKDARGERSYPDVHAFFHWDPKSVRRRGKYTVAHFTNEHAACYVLTKAQLGKAIRSGGFLVDPHQEKYDLLCTAATDPYTQCGLKKVIPVSHIDEFTIHHLSNKYAGKVGVSASELEGQVAALLKISEGKQPPVELFATETKLPRALYSKDYYEPANENVVLAISKMARSVLSIGCAWGATERRLVEQGLRVVAVPLDAVISSGAAAYGVEMMYGDIDQIATLTCGQKFDCVLCLNVLHLVPNPAAVLSQLRDCLSADSALIIQIPNMMSLWTIRSTVRKPSVIPFWSLSSTGLHFSSISNAKNWCSKSGMKIDRTTAVFDGRQDRVFGRISAAITRLLPSSLATPFATSLVFSAKPTGAMGRVDENV